MAAEERQQSAQNKAPGAGLVWLTEDDLGVGPQGNALAAVTDDVDRPVWAGAYVIRGSGDTHAPSHRDPRAFATGLDLNTPLGRLQPVGPLLRLS